MSSRWGALSSPQSSAPCHMLHAHAQLLGKLAEAFAPPEPELQHGAFQDLAKEVMCL